MTAKPKAKLMKESRQRRIDAGLVRREYWATPEQHKLMKEHFLNSTAKTGI